MQKSFEEQLEEHKKQYWHGPKNKMIRYYYYVQRGLDTFNQARYILMTIFGLYIMFKMSNPFLLVAMFIACVPVLVVVGYVSIHHMAKPIEWLGIQFGSHWGRYNYTLNEQQVEELKAIRKALENNSTTPICDHEWIVSGTGGQFSSDAVCRKCGYCPNGIKDNKSDDLPKNPPIPLDNRKLKEGQHPKPFNFIDMRHQ